MNMVYGSGQTYTPVIGKTFHADIRSYGSIENPYTNFGNIYGERNSSTYPNYFNYNNLTDFWRQKTKTREVRYF